MTFPYLSDIVNAVFGTDLDWPIPVFGILVVAAIVVATLVSQAGVQRQEIRGVLPAETHRVVADLAMVSAIVGLAGARIFHIVDHFDRFVADPAAMILTRSGFSIYGGLCFGVVAGIFFLRRRRIPTGPMLDAVAPAMLLGYGIGRLGCQIVGDGDWGIAADLPLKPEWLPQWLWAETYEGNILGATIAEPGVYPTPLYEFAAALVLAVVLWQVLLRGHRAGFVFSLYLLFAGFERLLIEKIRVNVEHEVLGLDLTQAEMISMLVIVAGLAGVLLSLKTRELWLKILISIAGLTALSACVPW